MWCGKRRRLQGGLPNMGDVTISTNDTTIYYPSDWLIEGGPTFESMGCPEPEFIQEGEDVEPLQVIYNKRTKFFGVAHNGFIVMESKESKDLGKYIQEYMKGLQDWVETNSIEEVDNLNEG